MTDLYHRSHLQSFSLMYGNFTPIFIVLLSAASVCPVDLHLYVCLLFILDCLLVNAVLGLCVSCKSHIHFDFKQFKKEEKINSFKEEECFKQFQKSKECDV